MIHQALRQILIAILQTDAETRFLLSYVLTLLLAGFRK
jgi:hypothetical protein